MVKHAVTWGQGVRIVVGVLVIAAANLGGYLSLNRQQVWIFEHIMHWVGFGVVVVFALGERLSDWALKLIETLDRWILHRKGRAGLLLAVLVFTYMIFWCAASFIRHYYFNSTSDLAIFDQVIWNTAQGRLFSRSVEVAHHFADHVQPHLALLSLPY